MRVIHFCWLVLSMVTLAGCQNTPDSPVEKHFDVKAKVVAADMEHKTVTLDHEDIPGHMKAMKMKFPVQDAKLLEGIKPGDEVHGKLRVKAGESVITELHKR